MTHHHIFYIIQYLLAITALTYTFHGLSMYFSTNTFTLTTFTHVVLMFMVKSFVYIHEFTVWLTFYKVQPFLGHFSEGVPLFLVQVWGTSVFVQFLLNCIQFKTHGYQYHSFCRIWWPWERPFGVFNAAKLNKFNHRSRTGYVLGASGHRQHPWRWQSSSWHAQCRWQHPWWHFPRKPWVHLWFLHRWVQRYVSHHLCGPDGGLLAWWYPGCYHGVPCDDAWLLLFPDPCLLYHVQTSFYVFNSRMNEAYRLKLSFYTKPCTGRQPGAWNKPRACAGGFSHLVCSFCRVVVSWLWELTAKSFLQWKIQKNNVILSDFPYFQTLKTPSRYLHFLRRYSTFSGFKGKPDQGLSDWAPAWPREMAHLPFSVPREAWRIESDQWEWGKWVAWPMREVSLLKGGWFKYFELFWGFILFLYSYRFCTVLY